MSIKLVDLLIEVVFEDTNTHPVYDEYLTNPQSGRKIKVRSALSSKKHPLYQQALAYIQDKTGSEHGDLRSGTAEDPDIRMATGDMETDYEVAKMTGIDQFEDSANQETAMAAIKTIEASDEKINKHAALTDDKEKWESLSDEFRMAAIVSYRDEERSKHEALQQVVDTYTLEGLELPPEIQEKFTESQENIDFIEGQEAEEAESDEEGKSWTERFNDAVDADALKTFDEFLDDPEQESQGI